MERSITGWLLDVYAAPDGGVKVWVIDVDGVSHALRDTLTPMFFAIGAPQELRAVCTWLVRAGLPVNFSRGERYDLFARRNLVGLQVRVLVPAMYERIVRRVTTTFPALTYSHADLTIAQIYFFERELFPLCNCNVRVNEQNEILEIAADDSPWALDYALPPLKVMTLRLEGELYSPKNPAHGYRAPLEVGYDGREYVLTLDEPREMLLSLRSHLIRCDPDLILSDYGDSFLLSHLCALAHEYGVDLAFNRDDSLRPLARRARSRFSYGRILYQPAAQWLCGRLHLDRQSSFLFDDYELAGAFEVARLSQRAVQQSVRSSTGGAISAMETAMAYKSGCVIPLEKEETEEFQTAGELLASDRGGMIYQPITGMHWDVAELDFVAMYPSIMVRFNISGETMNCECCNTERCSNFVPELKSRVCLKRQGLIPATIGPLVQKRFAYKRLK